MLNARLKSSQEVVRRPLSPVSEFCWRKVSDGPGTIDGNKKALRLSLIARRSLGTLSDSRTELSCRLFFKHQARTQKPTTRKECHGYQLPEKLDNEVPVPIGQLCTPRKQPHRNEEIPIRKKSTPQFRHGGRIRRGENDCQRRDADRKGGGPRCELVLTLWPGYNVMKFILMENSYGDSQDITAVSRSNPEKA
jgi:hypothetical protein